MKISVIIEKKMMCEHHYYVLISYPYNTQGMKPNENSSFWIVLHVFF